jgi:pimeloyl-[acyl-carrier protein] methyl ester esterase
VTRPRRIVCVGGWGSTRDAWTDLARELTGFRLDPVPWWDCLDPDGGALEAALASPPAMLLGWSLGGLVVLRALLDGAAPGIPACLLSATARMGADAGYPGADPRSLRAMRARLLRDAPGVMADFAARCESPAASNGFAARFVARSRAVPAGKLAAGLSFLASADLRERLPDLLSPVLWIHGEKDSVVPVESARFAAWRSPSITLEVIPEAGHFLPSVNVREVAARIREHLS